MDFQISNEIYNLVADRSWKLFEANHQDHYDVRDRELLANRYWTEQFIMAQQNRNITGTALVEPYVQAIDACLRWRNEYGPRDIVMTELPREIFELNMACKIINKDESKELIGHAFAHRMVRTPSAWSDIMLKFNVLMLEWSMINHLGKTSKCLRF